MLRFLVSTDNHLGYAERDAIRGEDSFDTFEEVMRLAKESEVDFVLLGGDLFHSDNPSRYTLYRTMKILREYCLGEGGCSIDTKDGGGSQGRRFNFEDPNMKVRMPVFAIHGNHDDPCGKGMLSSLDLLQLAGLVNYFGKTRRGVDQGNAVENREGDEDERRMLLDDITERRRELDEIRLAPIRIEKGETKLSLYGLGNVRDRRLNGLFSKRRVFFMSAGDERKWRTLRLVGEREVGGEVIERGGDGEWCGDGLGDEDWFKLFVIHQNRYDRGGDDHIDERLFSEFDLVIWGHEHGCILDSKNNVIQPGSSVCTSLCHVEAQKKQVVVVEVRGREFRLIPKPLRTVRPFLIRDVSLLHLPRCVDMEAAVHEYLTKVVEDTLEEVESDGRCMLPLIRIRVDRSGATEINSHIFGRQFESRVANYDSILHFYLPNEGKDVGEGQRFFEESANFELSTKDYMDKCIKEQVEERPMLLLPALGFTNVVHHLAEKKDKVMVTQYLKDLLARKEVALTDFSEDIEQIGIKNVLSSLPDDVCLEAPENSVKVKSEGGPGNVSESLGKSSSMNQAPNPPVRTPKRARRPAPKGANSDDQSRPARRVRK